MFGKELQIKKYPYLSSSPNIIEYFSIIGYQESFIPKIIDTYNKYNNEYSPTVLSSITSNTDYGIVDNNLIISQIYPENPLIILINDDNKNSVSTSNVVYSFCFDSSDGKKKIFYTCYAFRFYENYKYYITKKSCEEYYIPKAFCIISQYYYFALFEYICKKIYEMFTKKESNELPVELIIYNIVNFIPSPINYSLHLDLFNNSFNSIKFDLVQLSGYPSLDFDLSEAFNILPLNLFIEIYLLTVLEQSMLFFSSNLEILNMIMIIMNILNYPCNDSTYFWHIVSVSKNNLVEENKFVKKIMESLLGVNMTYANEMDTSSFGNFHYIVDIDNKKIFLKKTRKFIDDEDIEEYNQLKNVQLYIENIIKEKDKNIESLFLKSYIERLKKYLELILLTNPDYTPYPKNKYVNFFKYSKEIIEKNKKIQEIFYDFFLNILLIFYQDNSLDSSFDNIKKDKPEEFIKRINRLKNIDENTPMNKDEKYFCELFRNTIKYKIYFENFIINNEVIDTFKIPFFFSEEFINIKMKDMSNKIINKLSLFSIIDSLYYSDLNNLRIINITLNNIFTSYLDEMKNHFKNFNSKKINENNNQLIIINKKILNKYIYLLNSYYEKKELIKIFPSIKIQQEAFISYIDRRYIINIIQNTLEHKNYIELSDYLIYAQVYIFAISLPLYSYLKMVNYLENIITSLSKTNLFIRKHIYIIIKAIYKFYLIHKEKKLYPNINVFSLKMYYYMLINTLNQNLLIPNEEMISILRNFFGKMINEEKDILNQTDKEIDCEANFKIEKDINFICFMKHCFTSKKYFKPKTMIKAAMKEINNCNIIIRGGKKQLQPTVEIKIQKYVYSSSFFSPKKIYKLIQSTFNEFFDNAELNMCKLKIKNVRDVITNLILYGLELNKNGKFIPIEFLIYTLYLFKNFEEKYGINK